MFYNNKGGEALVNKQFDLAYSYFKAAINTDSSFSASWGNLGVLFKQLGDLKQAEEMYRYAIALNADNNTAQGNLALLYKKNCRYESALPYLSDAIEIWNSIKFNNYKNLAYSYYNQGELYKSLGKYELSVQSFKKGIGLLSKNKELYYDLYIEQNYGLINLYLKFGKINLAKILIKNINLDRKTRGLNIIFIEKIPEEVYEDCSTFKT